MYGGRLDQAMVVWEYCIPLNYLGPINYAIHVIIPKTLIQKASLYVVIPGFYCKTKQEFKVAYKWLF